MKRKQLTFFIKNLKLFFKGEFKEEFHKYNNYTHKLLELKKEIELHKRVSKIDELEIERLKLRLQYEEQLQYDIRQLKSAGWDMAQAFRENPTERDIKSEDAYNAYRCHKHSLEIFKRIGKLDAELDNLKYR